INLGLDVTLPEKFDLGGAFTFVTSLLDSSPECKPHLYAEPARIVEGTKLKSGKPLEKSFNVNVFLTQSIGRDFFLNYDGVDGSAEEGDTKDYTSPKTQIIFSDDSTAYPRPIKR